MATKSINVDMLAKMFLAGAQNIEAKKEFTYRDNGDSVIIHFSGDLMPSTFKYTATEDVLLIEDSFGTLVRYKRNKE